MLFVRWRSRPTTTRPIVPRMWEPKQSKKGGHVTCDMSRDVANGMRKITRAGVLERMLAALSIMVHDRWRDKARSPQLDELTMAMGTSCLRRAG